jgi:predicted glycosyltransferase
MKIWIDFINTPQVTFFIPFIEDFRKNGHEVMLTCRDSGNTVALLEQYNLPFQIIGEKAGKGKLQKLMLFPRRLISLFSFITKNKPDIAASQSSFYQPIVARLMGIPCLYTNDNEHAKGNFFGFFFANRVILPVMLKENRSAKRWPLKQKLSFYPSVKEAIYLSQRSDLKALTSGKKSRIYFRPEPWSAQYYSGPLNFFDETLLKLAEEYELMVLPRDGNQREHYLQAKFKKIHVAQKPLLLDNIISDCLLFIGAGGSMTREMAVLNIPVISIYQSDLLAVDNYLIGKGCMVINNRIRYDEIKSFIASWTGSANDNLILREGEQSFTMIKNQIYTLKHE